MKYTFTIFLFLLSINISFAQDKPDGPYKDYYDSGELKVEGQYQSNKRFGEWKSYHKNGQISKLYSYTNGRINNEDISYFESGIISSKTEKEGDVYVRTGYYKSGNLKYKREVNSGYFKSYYESGTIEIEATYFENDLVGDWKKYYENGQIEWLVIYKAGYREGLYKQYYDNGELKLSGKNLKDKVNGEEKRFLPGEVLEWEGAYKSGVFVKTWTQYDKDGNKLEKVKFKDGVASKSEFKDVIMPTKVANGVSERVAIYPGCEEMLTNKTRKKCMNQNVAQFVVKNFDISSGRGLGLTGRQRIFVMFKVGKTGEVMDIKVKAPHPVLKKEAIRVISLLPDLKPGRQRGKAVIMPFALPLVFQVQ